MLARPSTSALLMDSPRQSHPSIVSTKDISPKTLLTNNGIPISATDITKIHFFQKLKLKEKQEQPLVLVQRLEHHLSPPFVQELHARGSLKVLRANCKPRPKRKKLNVFQIVTMDTMKKNPLKGPKKILTTGTSCISNTNTKTKSNNNHTITISNNKNSIVSTTATTTANSNNNNSKCSTDTDESNNNRAEDISDLKRVYQSNSDTKPAVESVLNVTTATIHIPNTKPATDVTPNMKPALYNNNNNNKGVTTVRNTNNNKDDTTLQNNNNNKNNNKCGTNGHSSNTNKSSDNNNDVNFILRNSDNTKSCKSNSSDNMLSVNNGCSSSSSSSSSSSDGSTVSATITTTTQISSTLPCSIPNNSIKTCNSSHDDTTSNNNNNPICDDGNTESTNCIQETTTIKDNNDTEKQPEKLEMNLGPQEEEELEEEAEDEKKASNLTLPSSKPSHSESQAWSSLASAPNVNPEQESGSCKKVDDKNCINFEAPNINAVLHNNSHTLPRSDPTPRPLGTAANAHVVKQKKISVLNNDPDKSSCSLKAKEFTNHVCSAGKRQDFVCKQKESARTSGGGIPKIILHVKGKGPDKQYVCANYVGKNEKTTTKNLNGTGNCKKSPSSSIPAIVSKPESGINRSNKHKLSSDSCEAKKRHKSSTEGKGSHSQSSDSASVMKSDCPKGVVSENFETIASIIKNSGDESNDSFSDSLPDLELIIEIDKNDPYSKDSSPSPLSTEEKSCEFGEKKNRLVDKKTSEENEKMRMDKPSKVSSLNHKYLGKPTAHVEPYVAEPTLRSSSRKGKGFYDEDIPFPLDQDEVAAFETATSEISVSSDFSKKSVAVSSATRWKNCIRPSDLIEAKHQSSINHGKKTSKSVAHYNYYEVLCKLNVCLCRPLSNGHFIKKSKCPLHHKVLPSEDSGSTPTTIIDKKNLKMLTLLHKGGVNGKIKECKLSKKCNGECQNHNHKCVRKKSPGDYLLSKYPKPSEMKKREYFTPNLLREISKHGATAEEKFAFSSIKPSGMSRCLQLSGTESLQPKQRPRSLSIDSALSLFKVRVEDSALMFPLKRSSSLINFRRRDYPIPDSFIKFKRYELSLRQTSAAFSFPPDISDSITSETDTSNTHPEMGIIEKKYEKNELHVEVAVESLARQKDDLEVISGDGENCPKPNGKDPMVQAPSPPFPPYPERENNLDLETKQQKKKQKQNEKEKKNNRRKVRKLQISLPTPKKSGDSSSPIDEEMAGDSPSAGKKTKKKAPPKKKLVGEDFKDALEDRILKFHELEKERRLAQEIPGFNWLEEKIRNGSTATSSATPTTTKMTVSGAGVGRILPPYRPLERSLSWSSTVEMNSERAEPSDLKSFPGLLSKGNDHGVVAPSLTLSETLFSFPFRAATLDKEFPGQPPPLLAPETTAVVSVSIGSGSEVAPSKRNLSPQPSDRSSETTSASLPGEAQRHDSLSTVPPSKKQKPPHRLGFYEERASPNKAFMHLQTAVTAMPPTSKALPKRRTTTPSIQPLPTTLTSIIPASAQHKSNPLPQRKAPLSPSGNSTISVPPTSVTSTQNSTLSAHSITTLSVSHNSIPSPRNTLSPAHEQNSALSIPHNLTFAASHTSTLSSPSSPNLSTQHNSTLSELHNSTISILNSSIDSSQDNTISIPQDSIPAASHNSALPESKSALSLSKNSPLHVSHNTSLIESHNSMTPSTQSKSVSSGSYNSIPTVSQSEFFSPTVTSSTVATLVSTYTSTYLPTHSSPTRPSAHISPVPQTVVNTSHLNSTFPSLILSFKSSQPENILTSTNLTGTTASQSGNYDGYETAKISSMDHISAASKEKTIADSDTFLTSSTTPVTTSSPALSSASLSPPPLSIPTPASPSQDDKKKMKQTQSLQNVETASLLSPSRQETTSLAANLTNKKEMVTSNQCCFLPPLSTPKLSIFKEAFKNRLSAIHDDAIDSSPIQENEVKGESKKVKKNLNVDETKDEGLANSSDVSKVVLKEPDKAILTFKEKAERPVLISIPEALPSVELVLRDIKVNNSLQDNILGKETKEYETPSLIAALYEELLRTRQEVEKLRKIQEQMLNTDSVKKHTESQPSTLAPPQQTQTSPIPAPQTTLKENEKDRADKEEPPVIDITKDDESHHKESSSFSSCSPAERPSREENASSSLSEPVENLIKCSEDSCAAEPKPALEGSEESHKRAILQEDSATNEFGHLDKRLRHGNENFGDASKSSQTNRDPNRPPSLPNHSRLRDLLGISSTELDVVPVEDNVSLRSVLSHPVNARKEYNEVVHQKETSSFLVRPESVTVTTTQPRILPEGGRSVSSFHPERPEVSRSVSHSTLTGMPGLIPTNSTSQGARRVSETYEEYVLEPDRTLSTTLSNSTKKSISKTAASNLVVTDHPRLQAYQSRQAEENKVVKQHPILTAREQQHLHQQQQEQHLRTPIGIPSLPQNQSRNMPERRFSVQRSPKPPELCIEEKRHFMPQYISSQREVMDNRGQTLFNINCGEGLPTSPQMFQPKIIIPPHDKDVVPPSSSSSSATSSSTLEWPPEHPITSQESIVNVSQVSHHPLLTSTSHSYSSLIKRPSAFVPSQSYSDYRQNSNNKSRLAEIFSMGHSMNGGPPPPLPPPPPPPSLPPPPPNQTKSSFPLKQQHHAQQEHFVNQQMKQHLEKNMNNPSIPHMENTISISQRISQNHPNQFYPSQLPYKKEIPPSHPMQSIALQSYHPLQSVGQVAHQPQHLPSQSVIPHFHNLPPQFRSGIQIAENLQQMGAYREEHPPSRNSSSQSHILNPVSKPRPSDHMSPSYPNKPTYQTVPKQQTSPTHNNSLHNNGSNIPAHMQTLSAYQGRVPLSQPSAHQSQSQGRMNLQLQPYQSIPLNKTAMMKQYKLASQSELSSAKHDNSPSDIQRKQLYPVTMSESHQHHPHQQNQQAHIMPNCYQVHPAVVAESSDYNAPNAGVALGVTSSISPPPKKKKCLVCPQSAQFLCSGCKTAWYCSKECQRQHWAHHSPSCGARRLS